MRRLLRAYEAFLVTEPPSTTPSSNSAEQSVLYVARVVFI
jgi:hypothetical protein